MANLIRPQRLHTRPDFSLRDFQEKRNNILILRVSGGLGDILMHRMMFYDFKRAMPDAHLVFGCPKYYHEAASGHPYVDEVVDRDIDTSQFPFVYHTTGIAVRWERRMAPNPDKHRSDIWAEQHGLELTKHDMFLDVEREHKEFGKYKLKEIRERNKPSVILCPITNMHTKNLLPEQMVGLTHKLREKGCFVFAAHNKPISCLEEIGVPVLSDLSIRQWMGTILAADYVVAVDTAAFHFAGDQKKPMVGIFTFADGKVYGKYFDFILVQKHRDNGDWPCGPCYDFANCPKTKKALKPCLTEITVEMIMEGVEKMFEKWPV